MTEQLGFDGTGVGVAIIDSGVTRSHDDLGGNRVVQFVDFVDYLPQAHDGYGHGTHVAGIIAGNGYDSDGARRGIAPGAHLIVLRRSTRRATVTSATSSRRSTTPSNIAPSYNIRVINLSVAAGVYESYTTDPLTLAAKRAVDAGIVVVTAAGNHGQTRGAAAVSAASRRPGMRRGCSPSAPRSTTAPRSAATTRSRLQFARPDAFDRAAKPDVVAPGVAIESLADAGSTLFRVEAPTPGSGAPSTPPRPPYISLTGTSMAAPVVTGDDRADARGEQALTPN